MALQETYLKDFAVLLSKNNEKVGNLKMTSGNYDDRGNLINRLIPTITTDFCEIGIHNIIYLVFIIYSDTHSKELFNLIKDFSNIKIYGFKNFLEVLYPIPDFNYKNFEKKIKEDKYLQIQFSFNINITQEKLFKEYIKLKEIFIKSNVIVVNQLEVDLVN